MRNDIQDSSKLQAAYDMILVEIESLGFSRDDFFVVLENHANVTQQTHESDVCADGMDEDMQPITESDAFNLGYLLGCLHGKGLGNTVGIYEIVEEGSDDRWTFYFVGTEDQALEDLKNAQEQFLEEQNETGSFSRED